MSENKNLPQEISVQKRREYLQSLVLAIYRVTAYMPPTDHLRIKLREEALNVASHAEHLTAGNRNEYSKFIACVQILVHYCEIAEQQEMSTGQNFAVLKHALFNLRNSYELSGHDKLDEEHLVFLSNTDLEKQAPAEEPTSTDEGGNKSGKNKESDSSNTDEESYKATPAGSPNNPPKVSLADNRTEEPSEPSRVTNLREWNKQNSEAGNPPVNLPTEAVSRVAEKTRDEENTNQSYRSNKSDSSNQPNQSLPTGQAGNSSNNTKSKKQTLSTRQKKVLQYISDNKEAEVSDLAKILPDVSKRTIRRDLDKLSQFGHIKKHGRTNGAKYVLI